MNASSGWSMKKLRRGRDDYNLTLIYLKADFSLKPTTNPIIGRNP
jgi:hypothetical protein